MADADSAISAIGTRPAPIPVSRYLQDPAVTVVNPTRQVRGFIGFDWTFDIAKDWSITNRFAWFDVYYPQRIADYASVDELTGNITYFTADTNGTRRTVSGNLDLNGKFETGPFNHAVLIGTDSYQFNQPHDVGCEPCTNVHTINLFAPVYSFSGFVPSPDNFFFLFRESWKGVYAQDFISFADDRLHLLIGGRYDWAENGNGFSSTSLAQAEPKDPIEPDGNAPQLRRSRGRTQTTQRNT